MPLAPSRVYERAFRILIDDVVGHIASHDPMIGLMPLRPQRHIGRTRNVTHPEPVDHSPMVLDNSLTIDLDIIRNTDVEAITDALSSLAVQIIDQVSKGLFTALDDVTKATGNRIEAEGRPISWDMVLDMIEKIDIGFDSQGNPKLPTMVANPKTVEMLSMTKRTREHDERYKQIMSKKKAEYASQKRARRISKRRY